jgi:type VI secretion system protein ImpB
MAESMQHKLDRVRRPRVQITYDVETGGAMKKVELPFVVGVLADLSGQPKEALKPLKERNATFIDRDNFNQVMAKQGVRLALRVPNKLTDPNSKLAMELNFKHIDDFEPAKVAEQIEPLKKLLDARQELTLLLSRMEGNDKLEQLLESILTNQDKAAALEQYMDNPGQSVKAVTRSPATREEAPPAAAVLEASPAVAAAEEPAPAAPADEVAVGATDLHAIDETPAEEPPAPAAEEPTPAEEPAAAKQPSAAAEPAATEEPAPAESGG